MTCKHVLNLPASFPVFLGLIVTACIAIGAMGMTHAGHAIVGKAAPAFSVPTTRGGQVSLAGLKGKVVAIAFVNAQCEPCRKELAVLEELHTQNLGREVAVIVIGTDRKRAVVRSLTRAMSITVGHDPMGRIAGKYEVATMPTVYIIDKGGIVRDIKEGWTDVDVLTTLQSMVDRRLQ